ncbi:MAG: hypothetical protein KKF46_07065 [Nanoarchaeota archaeon]|nr:hypothetical protein [Nanoarchaeota archaeon]MBU1322088.1 hypothetical protein [Nanoarchaeota archaeon]MBU1597906.1 hypothetical protein [Nanoarchaeota archaeon]MBU2442068.1 hypothetical protein [Nanoarchaeota archaeon]
MIIILIIIVIVATAIILKTDQERIKSFWEELKSLKKNTTEINTNNTVGKGTSGIISYPACITEIELYRNTNDKNSVSKDCERFIPEKQGSD